MESVQKRRRRIFRLASMVSVACLTGCYPPPTDVHPPATLRRSWMFGVERMTGDPGPQLPYTNRMIADLAAMPNVQVVFVGDERNRSAFASWHGDKLSISPWLHGEGNCMNITYSILQSGQRQATFGLAIAPLAAGQEPDSACVDRAATQLYQALALQGL